MPMPDSPLLTPESLSSAAQFVGSLTRQTPRETPLLIVHRDGSVELNGTEAENEIAVGKALAAMAYGIGRLLENRTEP